jgi:hypothetical protein
MSLIAIAATAVLLAQAPAEPQKKADANQPVTLNGCVVRETASDNSYTFTDNNGLKYRLAGKSVSRYSGLSVEVVGIVDRRNLKVTGGLWPSTNIAAQAGSLDPSKAAIAALPGGGTGGTGNVDLPTLRVTRVGVASGECRR